MTIQLQKFGSILTSRQAGREALAAFRPTLHTVSPNEDIVVSFVGVSSLAPSWADEFLTPLRKEFKDKLIMQETDNASVKATLGILGIHT